jgi:photosystem II stability/assembly factor-like uncharacterized protein
MLTEMDSRPPWQFRWFVNASLALLATATFVHALLFPSGTVRGQSADHPAEASSPASPKHSVWKAQKSGTTASLRGIHSVDGKIAWASGTGGTVLRTTSSGAQWQKCAIPGADGETLDLRGIQAWDALTAIVMATGPGDKSRLYKTTDGCKSWSLIFKNPDSPDGFFGNFWIDAAGKGLLVGDPVRGLLAVFRTRDRGLHWQRELRGDLNIGTVELGPFAASNGSILYGLSDHGPARGIPKLFAVGGKGGSFVFSWYPGLCTMEIARDNPEECDKPEYSEWKKIAVPIASESASAGVFAVGLHQNFADRWRMTVKQEEVGFHQVIVAVGGDYTKPNDGSATAAWSEDEGKTWTAAANPPHGYRSSVAWSADWGAWIAAGPNGSDVSRDDGKTWQPLDDGNWNALSLPFAVGPKGRIARLSKEPASQQ